MVQLSKALQVVLSVSLQILVPFPALVQPPATGRPMRWRTIGPASSGLGEGLASRDVLVLSRSNNSCGGPGACTLTRSPGERGFLWHIGAAGFQVKRAVCQEAAWLGGVVFRISPESVRELQRWDKTISTNWKSQGKKILSRDSLNIEQLICFWMNEMNVKSTVCKIASGFN